MKNINSPSQYTRFNKTFVEIASNTTLSKMNQENVFNFINNTKQIEYFTKISKIITAVNIQFVPMSHNVFKTFCGYFNSQTGNRYGNFA